MSKETILKGVYTAAALLLAGLQSQHIIPDALAAQLQMLSVYLVAHSFLPSAKTGSPQG